MKYIILVERSTADYSGNLAQKYTEAYQPREGENLDQLFERIRTEPRPGAKQKYTRNEPALEIKIVAVSE